MTPDQRVARIAQTLDAGTGRADSSTPSILPEEVIVSATVVAANLPGGEELAWDNDVPGLSQWLPRPVPPSLAGAALRALDAAIPTGGWWWRSWTDESDRRQIAISLEQIRATLSAHG
jgi:hypothetical protein